MNITPGTTIERGDTVTRQTIFDLVANAVIATVQASDLNTEVLPIVVASSQSDANLQAFPGRIWWDQTEQLGKVYTDMIDGTGCSVWLAFGPDRFDVALLAVEPIPFGAAVQLTGEGRKARLPPLLSDMLAQGSNFIWEVGKVVGFNNDGIASAHSTTPSGSWFACAVDGYVWCWYPVNRGTTGLASDGGLQSFDSLIRQTDITGPSGISNVRGGLVTDPLALTSGDDRTPLLCHSHTRVLGNLVNWQRRLFYGPRIGKPG